MNEKICRRERKGCEETKEGEREKLRDLKEGGREEDIFLERTEEENSK